MKHLILPLAALCGVLFVAAASLDHELVHCPFQYRMENGSLCKTFNSTRGNRVFTDCSYGNTYVNPETFSPVEVCND